MPATITYGRNDSGQKGMVSRDSGDLYFMGQLDDPLAIALAPAGTYQGSFTVTITPTGFSGEVLQDYLKVARSSL